MTEWRSQSGKIQVGCAIGVIVAVLAIWVGIKTVPVVANVAEFDKTIQHEAERINVPGNNVTKLKKTIARKASSLDIPVTEKDIEIKRSRSSISVFIEYTLEIDYSFYVYQWHKVHDIERPLF